MLFGAAGRIRTHDPLVRSYENTAKLLILKSFLVARSTASCSVLLWFARASPPKVPQAEAHQHGVRGRAVASPHACPSRSPHSWTWALLQRREQCECALILFAREVRGQSLVEHGTPLGHLCKQSDAGVELACIDVAEDGFGLRASVLINGCHTLNKTNTQDRVCQVAFASSTPEIA